MISRILKSILSLVVFSTVVQAADQDPPGTRVLPYPGVYASDCAQFKPRGGSSIAGLFYKIIVNLKEIPSPQPNGRASVSEQVISKGGSESLQANSWFTFHQVSDCSDGALDSSAMPPQIWRISDHKTTSVEGAKVLEMESFGSIVYDLIGVVTPDSFQLSLDPSHPTNPPSRLGHSYKKVQ